MKQKQPLSNFDLNQKLFCFPLFVGLFCQMGKKCVCCYVDKKSGEIKLKSFNAKNSLFYHAGIPILRGIEFFVFSIISYFQTLKIFAWHRKSINAEKESLDILKKTLLVIGIAILMVIGALFVGWGIFGALPSKIGFWIFPNNYSPVLKKFCIALVRLALIVLLILTLWFVPKFKAFCRFNTAGNITIKGKNFSSLNFFNVVSLALLIDVFVVTLLGLTGNFFLVLLVNIVLFLLAIGVSFEICLFQEKKGGLLEKLCMLTSFLFFSPCGKTEKQVANGVIMECELMKNEDRVLLEENDLGHGEVALAFVLADVKNALKKAGIEDFGEAEWLVANVLGVKKLDIRFVKAVTSQEKRKIDMALERRLNHEPIDKIFGFTEFYGLKFKVNKNVLSPRQETELLVENVLKEIEGKKVRVLDLCTGSGAIAISVAKHSQADVLGADISESALSIAKFNAENLGANVKFKQSDMFSKLGRNKFDIIVSNPPYIKTNEIELLEKEVKNFDPRIALDGGEDGLYFYRLIASLAPMHLKPKGKLFLEIGFRQGTKLKKLLTENFENIKILKDYEGKQRIVVATKKG